MNIWISWYPTWFFYYKEHENPWRSVAQSNPGSRRLRVRLAGCQRLQTQRSSVGIPWREVSWRWPWVFNGGSTMDGEEWTFSYPNGWFEATPIGNIHVLFLLFFGRTWVGGSCLIMFCYIYIIIYHVPQPESCIKKCHDMLGKGRNKMSALRFFRPKCFWKSVDWRTWSCFDVFSWDSSGLPGFPS